MTSTITLPIRPEALKRLAAEADANGITPEEHAANLLEEGFGCPAGDVLADILGDAASEVLSHRE